MRARWSAVYLTNINQEYVATKPTINLLGIVFDSKLQWAPQVAASISKATRALNGLRLTRRCFNTSKLLSLVTSTGRNLCSSHRPSEFAKLVKALFVQSCA